MKDIFVLNIDTVFSGMNITVHPVVLRHEGKLILIDTGYHGGADKIIQAIRNRGLTEEISHIALTHHDHDHIGSLGELKKHSNAIVMSSGDEEPYISGRIKPHLLSKMEAMQTFLPPAQMDFSRELCATIKKVKPVEVDTILKAGEVLPWCGGCIVIPTPGHSKGHISFYIPKEKTFIAGDALDIEKGRPAVVNKEFCYNPYQAVKTLNEVLKYDIETLICYHSGRHVLRGG